MKRYRLNCELLDEVVLSERSATAGAHRSLDYLPGATFLGAVAARLYAALRPADAFTVFHSGKVRFCNALPMIEGRITRPVPLCLHERKNEPAGDIQLDPSRLYNFIHPDAREACRSAGAQPRQLRSAWLTGNGQLVRPARVHRMKTAIDAATGRAAEGQLFGYQSLQPHTRFEGEVQFDTDIPDTLCDAVLELLHGTLRIGRSRSAQYGRVACTVEAVDPLPHRPAPSTRLTLWLLSDLAASRHGAPTFTPEPSDLLLSTSGRLDVASSFIRTRRYAPYNTHRRLNDLERQVIVSGSVLVYELDHPLSDSDLQRLNAGLGEYRECGLGQVLVNPELLSTPQPRFAANGTTTGAAAPAPNHPLIVWLTMAGNVQSTHDTLKHWVRDKVTEWAHRQESARRFAGLADFEAAGPTRTQWGVVEASGKNARSDHGALQAALFGPDAGICRGTNDWERPFGPGWAHPHLRAWLEAALSEAAAQANTGLALARLAGAIQKSLAESSYHQSIQEFTHED